MLNTVCDQTLSYSNNTSSMLRHLRSKHPNALANETPATEHHYAPTGEGKMNTNNYRSFLWDNIYYPQINKYKLN